MSELATVVVVPREQFRGSVRALEILRRDTEPPFSLIYVDGGSPRGVARELARICSEEGFELVRTERYLSPNEARNLGLARVRTRYAVFVDNDVVVTPGWLDALVDCAEETGAWVVGPLYCIGRPEHQTIHMAGGEARIVETDGQRRLQTTHRHQNEPLAVWRGTFRREPCELAEFHCMLVHTEAFAKLGPLDEDLLNSREHIDFCMAVREAGKEVWFEPAALLTYVPPPPFALADLPYYLLRWNDAWGKATARHFNRKWSLDDDPARIVHRWIRFKRRAVFRPFRRRLQRLFGDDRGGALAIRAIRVVEWALTAFARRRGGDAAARV